MLPCPSKAVHLGSKRAERWMGWSHRHTISTQTRFVDVCCGPLDLTLRWMAMWIWNRCWAIGAKLWQEWAAFSYIQSSSSYSTWDVWLKNHMFFFVRHHSRHLQSVLALVFHNVFIRGVGQRRRVHIPSHFGFDAEADFNAIWIKTRHSPDNGGLDQLFLCIVVASGGANTEGLDFWGDHEASEMTAESVDEKEFPGLLRIASCKRMSWQSGKTAMPVAIVIGCHKIIADLRKTGSISNSAAFGTCGTDKVATSETSKLWD